MIEIIGDYMQDVVTEGVLAEADLNGQLSEEYSFRESPFSVINILSNLNYHESHKAISENLVLALKVFQGKYPLGNTAEEAQKRRQELRIEASEDFVLKSGFFTELEAVSRVLALVLPGDSRVWRMSDQVLTTKAEEGESILGNSGQEGVKQGFIDNLKAQGKTLLMEKEIKSLIEQTLKNNMLGLGTGNVKYWDLSRDVSEMG